MKHDDFCVDSDPLKEDCTVCSLIARVRRDERDRVEGGEEWDKDAAYQEGYEAGKATVEPSSGNGVVLSDIRSYILERLPSLTEAQVKALYDMYISFGGE